MHLLGNSGTIVCKTHLSNCWWWIILKIGSFIKLHRIEQKMTQEELALGIVSVSYLSKIENDHTLASTEIISLLCKRLNIEPLEMSGESLQELCQEWYSKLFEVNDKNEIIELYEKIKSYMKSSIAEELLMFEIHTIRYLLVIGRPKEACKQIEKLSEIEDTFDHTHAYFWYKFRGNYHSIYNEFNKAMKMYQLAEETGNVLDLSNNEKADLQYTIGVTHSKLRNTLETIDYAESALKTYREQYNFIRCAQCHILLGISYRRIRLYEKAIENHNLAKQLGELNNNRQVIQLANQNLGYLYSTTGNNREAMKHYEAVVNDTDVDLNARLPAIASLIKEYYSIEEIGQTRNMVNQGLDLLDQLQNKKRYQLYYYIIYTYQHVLNGEMESFEKIVTEEFLPYLELHKDYVNIVVYTTMLADYYEKLHKYKDAVFYHKQASQAYEQLTNI